MANISAADVYKLREITGAGVMDCKNALTESDGDIQQAIDILRKKGQKLANKRADRDANEGIVVAHVDESKQFGAVLMLNCETDFVGKNEEFVANAHSFIEAAVAKRAKSMDEMMAITLNGRTIADQLTDMVGKIGEKIQISHYEYVEGALVAIYNHHSKRVSSIVAMNQGGEAVEAAAKDITMQIAAMSPVSIDQNDCPKEVIEKEIEIGKEQARAEGKAEEMVEKIAIGKLNRFYKDSTLLNQDFIKDGSMNVGKYLSNISSDLKVISFKRLALGA